MYFKNTFEFLKKHHLAILLCLIALSFLVYFWDVERVPLYEDEVAYAAFNSVCDWVPMGGAMRIYHEGFYGLFHALEYTCSSRPLIAILMAVSMWIFGLNDFAVRFFFVLSGVLGVIVIYFLAKALFKKRYLALLSVFLMLICVYHYWFSRIASGDSSSSLLMVLSMLFLFRWSENKKLFYLILSGFFAGLFPLIKPSGFIIIPIFIFYYLFTEISLSSTVKHLLKKIFSKEPFIFLGIIFLLNQANYIGFSTHPYNQAWNDWFFQYKFLQPGEQAPTMARFFGIARLVTYPIAALSVLGIILTLIHRKKENYLLLFWVLFSALFALALPRSSNLPPHGWFFSFRESLFIAPPIILLSVLAISYLIGFYNERKGILAKPNVSLVRKCIIIAPVLIIAFVLVTNIFSFLSVFVNPASEVIPWEERVNYIYPHLGRRDMAKVIMDLNLSEPNLVEDSIPIYNFNAELFYYNKYYYANASFNYIKAASLDLSFDRSKPTIFALRTDWLSERLEIQPKISEFLTRYPDAQLIKTIYLSKTPVMNIYYLPPSK